MRVSFTQPLPEEKKVTPEEVQKQLENKVIELEAKIKEAIEAERDWESKDKYENRLTTLESYNYEIRGMNAIPLGRLIKDKELKWPEKVLVVYKVEEKEVSPWEKAYEGDVLAISEVANVSPSAAKEMLSKIKALGYSITKPEEKEESEVKLLWFDDGWDDSYPVELDWVVTMMGEDKNLITGYDCRGILIIKQVPDGSKLYIKAGYREMRSEFKEKSSEIKALEAQIENLKKELEDKNKEVIELQAQLVKEAEKEFKRDIAGVTIFDVLYGSVKIDYLLMQYSASGVFLGNAQSLPDIAKGTIEPDWRNSISYQYIESMGIILTNAHVAQSTIQYEWLVSEDHEVMYLITPAKAYARYTRDSDLKGSPLWLLITGSQPVMSWDYDCAIMTTSAVPEYEQYAAPLGNSDNVRDGDPIVSVGNPFGLQKYTTVGVVANTDYSFLDSLGRYKISELNGTRYRWLKHSCFWTDCTIGVGGVSGSAVFATEGIEKGKVIALRNMGMMQSLNDNVIYNIGKEQISINMQPSHKLLKDKNTAIELADQIRDLPTEIISIKDLKEKWEDIKLLSDDDHNIYAPVAGLNGAIPINGIKRYLQERGLDPMHFKFEGAKPYYWQR